MTDTEAQREINKATAGIRNVFDFEAFAVGYLLASIGPKLRSKLVAAVKRKADEIRKAVEE